MTDPSPCSAQSPHLHGTPRPTMGWASPTRHRIRHLTSLCSIWQLARLAALRHCARTSAHHARYARSLRAMQHENAASPPVHAPLAVEGTTILFAARGWLACRLVAALLTNHPCRSVAQLQSTHTRDCAHRTRCIRATIP